MTAIACRRIPLVLACLLLAVVAGCSGSRANKAGESSEKTVVLTLAEHEIGMYDVGRWAREVERASGGTIRIDDRQNWRAKDRYDRAMIGDVRSGRVDIAKIPARSWDEVGVTSFRALLAPLLIDTYPLEQRVLASDLPARMLPAVGKLDLVGLAVLPGLLRKPLGVRRMLRTPQDFEGATIGFRTGGVPRMTLAALGSRTVAYVPGDSAEVARLDGVESDVEVINEAGYNRGARALTANVNLWPRVQTLVMNRRKFDALSDRQKEALRSAADAVSASQFRDIVGFDRQERQVLCRRGLKFESAKPRALAALAKAVRPVYAQLARDAVTKQFIAEIRAMKHRVGTGGGAVACGSRMRKVRTEASRIDGVYRSTVTKADLLRNPKYVQGEATSDNYGAFILRIANGRFEWTGAADGVPEGGTIRVDGDRHLATFQPTHPAGVLGEQYVYRWSTYRGLLFFTKVTLGPTLLVVHPWRRRS